MNRKDLIKKMQDSLPELLAKQVEEGVKLVFNKMVKSLVDRERIEIRNFGVFSVNHNAARISHNPRTGEKVHVPAKRKIHFKPGKELKERVNKENNANA